MEIERYEQRDRDEWDAVVRASRNGTFLFLRDYMEYHRDRFEDASLVARRHAGGAILAVLPANRRDDVLESHGGLTYGGWVFGADMTLGLMLEVFGAAVERLRSEPVRLLRYRPVPHVYHRSPAEEDLFALDRLGARLARRAPMSVIDLRRPLPWQERRRRGVRKAAGAGLTAGESDDLAGYWELLSTVLAGTYGATPVHSLDEMRRLRAAFPGNIRLFTCGKGGRQVAGVLVYETDLVARAQYIAASEEGKEAAALDLLFEHLVRRVYGGKAYFDLGTSEGVGPAGLNPGVLEYKEGLGARLVVQDTWELPIAAAGAG